MKNWEVTVTTRNENALCRTIQPPTLQAPSKTLAMQRALIWAILLDQEAVDVRITGIVECVSTNPGDYHGKN